MDEGKNDSRRKLAGEELPCAPGGDTGRVHLAADSSLRYEHVIRAVQVCTKHVTRIVFAKPAGDRQLAVTVGFVRDVVVAVICAPGLRAGVGAALFGARHHAGVVAEVHRWRGWRSDLVEGGSSYRVGVDGFRTGRPGVRQVERVGF